MKRVGPARAQIFYGARYCGVGGSLACWAPTALLFHHCGSPPLLPPAVLQHVVPAVSSIRAIPPYQQATGHAFPHYPQSRWLPSTLYLLKAHTDMHWNGKCQPCEACQSLSMAVTNDGLPRRPIDHCREQENNGPDHLGAHSSTSTRSRR
jgi:hypothetical protein